ncbi:MAG: diaminopimelate epimerase [Bacteroidota bacterium]
MQTTFFKYHGTGNDFILVDDREEHFVQETKKIAQLCHRRFGIGADGLILLQNHPELDFRMIYFNSDGKISSFCGNGGRCISAFAKFLSIVETKATFAAADGIHEARFKQDLVHLKMGDVHGIKHLPEGDFWLDTGSPHYVSFVEKLESLDVDQAGRTIRNSPSFRAEGTNVNFLEQDSDDSIRVRTYERGVEAETYSCGTGVTAAALVVGMQNKEITEVQIKTPGGNLRVAFNRTDDDHFSDIWLIGPAVQVFKGTL